MRDTLGAGLAAAALAFGVVAITVGIGGATEQPRASVQGELESGRAVFASMGCGSCHTLAAAGSYGQIGPNLDNRHGGFTAMPTDFASRMTAQELDSLVRFLLTVR